MYFKRLEMQGFKSFADQTSIDFHEGITCIVGPNGSGKSNISDAVRWVFGEQSPKSLRSTKMDEIIFSGSKKRKARGMAEVTVVIDNSSNILNIDFNEVAITRRLYRSGETEYLINKTPCRLKDIRELIMDTGIGVENYSIIGQGKIADIISTKPEDRRQIFFEAAGIVKYNSQKEETEKKLESTKNNLLRVDDIINELENRIDTLKIESEKAEKYLDLSKQQKSLDILINLKNIDNLELKNEYLKDEISLVKNNIDEIKEAKHDFEKIEEERNVKIEELRQRANEKKERLDDIKESIAELSNEVSLFKERLEMADLRTQKLETEIEEYNIKKKKIEEEINKTKEEEKKLLKEKEQQNLKLKKALNEQEAILKLKKEREASFSAEQKEKSELNESLTKKETEKSGLINLIDSFIKRKDVLEKESKLSEEILRESIESKIATEEKAVTLREKLDALSEKRNNLNEEINKKTKENDLIKKEYDNSNVKMVNLNARYRLLEEMESSYEGYNYAVKHIMKSNINGIIGVVADLIDVKKGYETAFETALAGGIQNIICVDNKSAEEAVNELKRNKAGRLTFLPVNDLETRDLPNLERLSGKNGFLGHAPDLMDYDRKLTPAINYLLGRTVIVDTLENANKLAKEQKEGLRFVTLGGELVNPAGAITGGISGKKQTGILERKAEKNELANTIELLKKENKQLKEKNDKKQEEIAGLSIEAENFDKEILKENKNLQEVVAEINKAGIVIENLERDIKKALDEKENIVKEVNLSEQKINDIDNKIKEISEKLNEKDDTLSDLTKEAEELLSEADEKLLKERLEFNNFLNLVARIEQKSEQLNGQLELFENEYNNRVAEISSIKENNSEINLKLEAKEKELLMKRSEKTTVSTELETAITVQNEEDELSKEHRRAGADLDNKLSDMAAQRHELELKLTRQETLVEGYKDKLWEDYEITYVMALEYQEEEISINSALRKLRQIKSEIKMLGDVNVHAIKEYKEVDKRYDFLQTQREDLINAIDSLENMATELDKTIKEQYINQFDRVALHFKDGFNALFGGGTAEIKLNDIDNPLESGIDIIAQPPGKKLQNIQLLSGGEKSLTAIALIFSLIKASPTPFCILDEIEASLDENNIKKFIDYLKEFENVQFVLVTHQRETMKYADSLYGVTMPEEGVSEVLSLLIE